MKESPGNFRLSTVVIWMTTAALTVFCLVLSLSAFRPICGWDVIVRYAPMADAFAAGNRADAFHPRFCFLFPLLTGTVARITGCGGLVACSIVATVFWGLSFPALWAVLRRVFDDTVAYIAALLVFATPEYFVYAVDGWRDDCRILPIALTLLAFFHLWHKHPADRPWKASAAMATAQFLSVSLRIDCIAVMSLALLVFTIEAIRRGQSRTLIAPFIAYFAALIADSLVVYFSIGWFVPAPQFIPFIERVFAS